MAHERITSVQNPLVKRLQLLLERKGREESGSYLVEGAHLVEEALKSGATVTTVLYDSERELNAACRLALTNIDPEVHVVAASEAVLAKLSETKSPQGIVAVVKKNQQNWEKWIEQLIQAKPDVLLLFLDEIQDPGNLGTILRTAEAAGVDGVVLGRGSVDLYNGKVVRATMGAMFRLPVFTQALPITADQWRGKGGRLLCSTLREYSRPYDSVDYGGKVAIVIGNEGRGVSEEMIAQADELVHIPIYGQAESLNAAVAAGLLVYEARRKKDRSR